MKKGGWLSFIIYLLYTLFFGGICLASYIEIQKNNAAGGDFENIGLAIVVVLTLVMGAIGLGALLLKLLHMATGFFLFGGLCLLIDLALVVVGLGCLPDFSQAFTAFDILVALPMLIAPIMSFVANIRSFRR